MPKLIGNKYYTLITDIGEAKIANNLYSGKKIDFALLKLGNGNDEEYNPDSSQTDLRKEVWRGNVVHVEIDEKNPNWINIYTVIPPGDGGFWIREMGVFDSDGDMIAICNVAPSYKPTLDEGSAKEITMKMTMAVTNTSVITLKVDPTVIYAKRKDVISLQTRVNDITTQLNAMAYEEAGGTATAITLNMPSTLKDGYWKKFIAGADNGGAATTINGKPFYKVCSTNPPNLKKDRPYEAYYNLTGDCFFLKASATGTAAPAQVLADVPFSNEDDTDLMGTMPNRGAPAVTLNSGGNYNIQPGYYSGGKIQVNSMSTQMVNNGVTLTSASQLISGVKAISKSGALLIGTATLQSLGGKNFETGKVDLSTLYRITATNSFGHDYYYWCVKITPSFTPRLVIVQFPFTATSSNPQIFLNMCFKRDDGVYDGYCYNRDTNTGASSNIETGYTYSTAVNTTTVLPFAYADDDTSYTADRIKYYITGDCTWYAWS